MLNVFRICGAPAKTCEAFCQVGTSNIILGVPDRLICRAAHHDLVIIIRCLEGLLEEHAVDHSNQGIPNGDLRQIGNLPEPPFLTLLLCSEPHGAYGVNLNP